MLKDRSFIVAVPMMIKSMKDFARYTLLMVFVVACTKDSGLRPFSSDGCSLFPDSSPFSDKDWCSCCFAHDVAYWRGGTQDERLFADEQLKACIIEQTGHAWLASAMFSGVRVGGSPYIYSWFRWGYGWPYERKYQMLSEQDNALADNLLDDYYANPTGETCEK